MVDVAPAPMQPRVGDVVAGWAAGLHADRGVRLVLGAGWRPRARRPPDGPCASPTARASRPTSPSSGSAACRTPAGWRARASRSATASSARRRSPSGRAGRGGGRRRRELAARARGRRAAARRALVQRGRAGAWAARTLVHGAEHAGPFATLPSFWSDQHGVRIQSIGLPALGTRASSWRAAPEEGAFVILYGREGRVVGAVSVGMPPRRLAKLRGRDGRGRPARDAPQAPGLTDARPPAGLNLGLTERRRPPRPGSTTPNGARVPRSTPYRGAMSTIRGGARGDLYDQLVREDRVHRRLYTDRRSSRRRCEGLRRLLGVRRARERARLGQRVQDRHARRQADHRHPGRGRRVPRPAQPLPAPRRHRLPGGARPGQALRLSLPRLGVRERRRLTGVPWPSGYAPEFDTGQ